MMYHTYVAVRTRRRMGKAMPIKETWARIEDEIAAHDLGKARDRLHGLLVTYPEDLAIRHKLGEVYRQLGHPAMAGRYWYLEQPTMAEEIAARRAFERSCGGSQLEILLALKFRGDPDKLRDSHARQKLQALIKDVEAEYGMRVHARRRGKRKYERTRLPGRWVGVLLAVGCLVMALVGLGLVLIGLATVVGWLL